MPARGVYQADCYSQEKLANGEGSIYPQFPVNPLTVKQGRLLAALMRISIPTDAEFRRMVGDLLHISGGGHANASMLLGIDGCSCSSLHAGRRKPSQALKRSCWLVWLAICRPNAGLTAFDLMTVGRFHRRGDPATAGTLEFLPFRGRKPSF